jgi:UDP-galactopyranose mutase
MKKALIIGGGFAGIATSHQLALLKGEPWDVTIIEAGPSIGAGVRTQFLGGHPWTFGPRHFLTQKQHVFDFLNTYLPMVRHPDHEFVTYVEPDKSFYSYPIHYDDIDRMPEAATIRAELEALDPNSQIKDFEDFWVASVGRTLYAKFIETYSKKMWMLDSNKKLSTYDWSPKGTAIKSGPRAAWDTAISAYPVAPDGYNSYFDLATANATIKLNTRFGEKPSNSIYRVFKDYDLVVSTIPPDTLCGFLYGRLPFIGRTITPIILPIEFALPTNVYFAYYAGQEPYTRVTEYKKFTRHHDPSSTLITIEQPSIHGRLYPLPTDSAQRLAKRYFAQLPKNVHSIGRAGSYDYRIDIDDCIDQAMTLVKEL